uniref:Protein S100-A1 n=3 Tax=Sylvioidea TaxID=2116661 RepID=A0A8C3QLM6_9PASS
MDLGTAPSITGCPEPRSDPKAAPLGAQGRGGDGGSEPPTKNSSDAQAQEKPLLFAERPRHLLAAFSLLTALASSPISRQYSPNLSSSSLFTSSSLIFSSREGTSCGEGAQTLPSAQGWGREQGPPPRQQIPEQPQGSGGPPRIIPLTFIRLGSCSRTSSLNSPAVSVPFLPSLAAKVTKTVTMRSMAASSSVSSGGSGGSAAAMAPDTPGAAGTPARRGSEAEGSREVGPSPPPQPKEGSTQPPRGLCRGGRSRWRRCCRPAQQRGHGDRGTAGPGSDAPLTPSLRAGRGPPWEVSGSFGEVSGALGRFYTRAAGGDSAAFVPPAPVLGFLALPDGRTDTARAPQSVRPSVPQSVLCSLPARAPDQSRAELAAASAAPPGDLRWGQEGTAGRESRGAGASPGSFHRKHSPKHSRNRPAAAMGSQLEGAMETLINVFHHYSGKEGDKYKLSKKELKELLQSELGCFLETQKDSGAVEKIMQDLDENGDGEVDFQEFVVLVAALTVACNTFFWENA